jgi:type VI secretion system protein ImpH
LDRLDVSPRLKLFVHCFGLFGPGGPMPLFFTDYALRRQVGHSGDADDDGSTGKAAENGQDAEKALPASTKRDNTLPAFLDVFHHRLISLFYRAWAASQKTVDLDRWQSKRQPHQEPRFTIFIGSLIGLGMSSLQDRDSVPDWSKLYYSGRLAGMPRNAEGLQAILADFFKLPVQIQTFAGHWLDLPPQYVCQLGRSPSTGTLGTTAIVGDRVWDRQLACRLRLGPMSLKDLNQFLPGGECAKQLRDWLLNYSGEEYFWTIQLVIRADQVPDAVLGRAGQIGRTAWLKSGPVAHDMDDIVFTPDQIVEKTKPQTSP